MRRGSMRGLDLFTLIIPTEGARSHKVRQSFWASLDDKVSIVLRQILGFVQLNV
jgi:hypothetical protein